MRPRGVGTNRMTHNAAVAAVLVLVTALVVAPVAAAVPAGGPGAAFAQETETRNQTAPGEQLSGVVSVQGAEVEGEVSERAFGVRVAAANSDASKAAVVADTVDAVEERIDELARRKAGLRAARENGSMSEGEYRARMATVATELATAQRLANASEATARGLPAAALAEKGVDVEAIRTLRERAGNLTGPEVAEIARSIAGRDVGRSMAGDGPPGDAGPPNGSDTGPPDDTGPPNSTDS
jgi:hypothetical protein